MDDTDASALARYETFVDNAAGADSRAAVHTLLTPVLAIGAAARAVGEVAGIVAPPPATPSAFDPRDAAGNRLATAILPQPARDDRCTAYAVGAMMEAWWCRKMGSADGVPHLSINDLFTGGMDVYATVEKAARGVVDELYQPPGPREPRTWKLKWKSFRQKPSARVDAMCTALVADGPLVAVCRMYKDFDDFHPADETAVYTPGPASPPLADAHAVCIIGFDTAARTWIVRNSVTSWGAGGYGRIAWRDRSVDLEHIVIGVTSVERAQ